MIALFDANPIGGGIGVFLGVAFLLVFAGGAFIAFKLLRKSLRMAFRIAVVLILLAIAIAGSSFFFLAGTSKSARPSRPLPAR